MCGIAGYVNFHPTHEGDDLLQRMGDLLRHRGPDGDGVYQAPDRQVGLAHRRLKIIDLSENARQPMTNEDGSIWLTYNGEIYNYQELDAILKGKGHTYRSQSDSETIIHAYEEWGEDCLERFNGMFAFALWDERKKRLFCARDRFGEKPFYYYADRNRFLFASEIKALLGDPDVPRELNGKALAHYLHYNLTDVDETTFFAHIKSLPAAHALTITNGEMSVRRYWSLPLDGHYSGTKKEGEWAERFLELLKDSIRLRLRSDVPLGTCLSGGLDSSTIISLMSQLVEGPISSFSVSYDEEGFSEQRFIRAVTETLPLQSHNVTPTGEDFYDTLHRIVWHNDEPSSSPGQYSQWHVMKLTAEHGVTVILNGQGGDELLAGYERYVPTYLRELLATGRWLRAVSEIGSDSRLHKHALALIIKQVLYPSLPGLFREFYRRSFSVQTRADDFLLPEFLADHPPNGHNPMGARFASLREHLARDLTIDSVPYLVHHEDRCSMAFSREIRLPFLDHRLVELAFRMPSSMKIRDGVTKHALRRAMATSGLPTEVLNRHDKKGYPTPVGKWFRTVAREETREILFSQSFMQRGFIDSDKAQRAFVQHCEGKADFTLALWQWVNVELWLRAFLDGA